MATIATFVTKDENEIRDDILRTYRNGMIERVGIDPNVTPNSDIYILASAVARELSVSQANAALKADELMFDTATGDALARGCAIFGLSKRAAAPSSGGVLIDASTTTSIAVDAELIDGAGLRYRVTVGGSYADGAEVPITAIDAGTDTNHDAGDVLTWVTPPAYCSQTVTVATGGLTGGAAEEDDETLRERLFAVLRNPPECGNPEHIAELAEASTTVVQKCFVYPALQGPGTVHIAVVGYTSDSSKSRVVSSTIVNNTVYPYVAGILGEHVGLTATSVTDVNTDVSVYLTLPSAPTASPPGAGGGWLDGTPWPRPSGNYCDVSSVTSTTVFAVNASAAPTAGVTRIAWLSPYDWTLYTATVVSYTGSGPYTVTIDAPFTGIAVGNFIWPQCTNQDDYVAAALEWFAKNGPGEKTANSTVLTRAFRHPTPQQSWPYSVNATMLRAISDVGDEVLDTSFLYRSTTTPSVPAAVSSAPNICVPRYLAFYPSV